EEAKEWAPSGVPAAVVAFFPSQAVALLHRVDNPRPEDVRRDGLPCAGALDVPECRAERVIAKHFPEPAREVLVAHVVLDRLWTHAPQREKKLLDISSGPPHLARGVAEVEPAFRRQLRLRVLVDVANVRRRAARHAERAHPPVAQLLDQDGAPGERR